MSVTTGQMTIVDYNDALSLTGFISANAPRTQLYNPDTGAYNPDFAVNNMILTASLFKIGSATDIINSAKTISWKDGAAVNFADASPSKVGKTLAVGDIDIDIKATFSVEVS